MYVVRVAEPTRPKMISSHTHMLLIILSRYMATYKDMVFQPALVATTSFVFLAIGLIGITYSVLSSSWDDDREGSALGIEEFGKNVNSLKDGLSRTKGKAASVFVTTPASRVVC